MSGVGTVFPYFGAKNILADRIVSLLPARRAYVEPYAGSLAVLRAKPPSVFECVNDLDGDLVAFWRVLRERCDELERLAALTPHSREEYTGVWPPSEAADDLHRAWRVWVQLTQGRGAQLRRTGWRHHIAGQGRGSGVPVTMASYVGRFAEAAERLRYVSLECRPAVEIIEEYGSDPDTTLYVDPPYLGSTRTLAYAVEQHTDDEHRTMAEALRRAKGAVVLSGYASELYDVELFPDWHRIEFTAYTGQANDKGSGARTEVVWSNVELHGGLW